MIGRAVSALPNLGCMAAHIDSIAREVTAGSRGLARTSALAAAGVPRSTIARRVRNGVWGRPHHGVVDVTRHGWDWVRRVLAAVLANAEGTVASHTSAAALHGLPGFRREGRIEITTPRRARMSAVPYAVHSSIVPDVPVDITGVPCASGARTLVGLGTCVGDRALARAARDALRRGLVDPAVLADPALDHVPGAIRARRTVAREQAAALLHVESPLEGDVVDRLLGTCDVPPFVTQGRIEVEGRTLRADIVWLRHRVVVEVDGSRWHADHLARWADAERQRLLEEAGWTVLRVSSVELADQAAWNRFLSRLRAALSV